MNKEEIEKFRDSLKGCGSDKDPGTCGQCVYDKDSGLLLCGCVSEELTQDTFEDISKDFVQVVNDNSV